MRTGILVLGLALLCTLAAGGALRADPPDASGPIVARYDDGTLAYFVIDQQAGQLVVFGADIVEFCQGNFEPDLLPVTMIDSPSDVDRIIAIFSSVEVTTSVWPFTTFSCALFTTTTPLATGMSRATWTDNDVYIYFYGNNNHNAYGLAAHGFLEDPSGAVKVFSGHWRCVWDGVDPYSEHCTSQITLVR